MFVLQTLAASRVGLAALAIMVLVVFYEGAPLGPVRWVPHLGPALEDLLDGRVDRERRAAALAERLAWQEAQRLAEAEHARRLAEAQAAADAAELAYLTEKALRENDAIVARAELDAALAQTENDDASDRSCAARPAISQRVSRALDKIGR